MFRGNSALSVEVCSLLQRPLLGGELKGQVLYLALTSVCCEYALEYETQ